MKFFSFKKRVFGESRSQRFRHDSFQARIRQARNQHRHPRIMPAAKTDIKLLERKLPRKLLFFGGVLAVVAGVYWVVFTEYFLVRTVQVSGNQLITVEMIEQWLTQAESERYWKILPKNNWFMFSSSNLERLLANHTTRVLEFKSRRVWPNGLKLTLVERVPVAIWQTDADYYYLSQDSVLVEQLQQAYATSTPTYLRIRDLSGAKVKPGDHLDVQKLLDFSLALSSAWERYTASQLAEVRTLGRAASEIIAESASGWVAYLNLQGDPLAQVQSLGLVLSREIQPNRVGALAYIDMRLGNTVYYCFINEPCAALTVP